jgi:phosphatidylcholine synthase
VNDYTSTAPRRVYRTERRLSSGRSTPKVRRFDLTPLYVARGLAVHLLTASGAALAFIAMIMAVRENWATMFLVLGAALIVDAVDGPIARRISVAETLPRWSGKALDFVVDFLTYVFVPAYALMASGLLPELLAVPLAILIVTTSALYFANTEMKTDDNYFLGFPALWNVAAFYVFLLKPAPWLSTVAILLLAVLTFVPFKFVHPFRVRRLRRLTVAVLAVWSILAAFALVRDFAPGAWVEAGLAVVGAYFLIIGLTERQ